MLNRSTTYRSSLLHGPQPWLWLAAGCTVASFSILWSHTLQRPSTTTPVAPRSLALLHPVQPPQETQLFPVGNRLEKARNLQSAERVVPVKYPSAPSATSETEVQEKLVHADWETDDPASQRRVQHVSVSYVEAEPSPPVWFVGSIEPAPDAVDPSSTKLEQPDLPVVIETIPRKSPTTDSDQLPLIIPVTAAKRK